MPADAEDMAFEPNAKEQATLATFDGRLQLAAFTFSTPTTTTTTTTPSTTTPSKRKAASLSSSSSSSLLSPSFSGVTKRRRAPKSGGSKAAAAASSSLSSSSSSSAYAPPSAYAHLPQLLPDALAPNLLIMFVGLNPGVRTAVEGHAYAHPSNHFWRLLHKSGITPRLCAPDEDTHMPELYSLGLTNIVSRPSRCGAELSKREMDAGVGVLEEKATKWRPEVVCFVGKGIWESVERVLKARGQQKDNKSKGFEYGWKDHLGRFGQERDGWKGARMFAATSTSGLAAGIKIEEKVRIWSELGVWAIHRRLERDVKREESESEVAMDDAVGTVKVKQEEED